MPAPTSTTSAPFRELVKPLFLVLALLTTLAVTQLVATPAEAAKGPNAITMKRTACFGATESEPWGGVTITLQLNKRRPPKGEPYLVVVDDVDGHEVDRFFADAPRYRTTTRIAADGLRRTPDLVITASVGGEVLGRARVLRNCGTLDPNPPKAPVIESVGVVGCDVSVTVANPADHADTILVALWPEGSYVAPMRAVDVTAGASGVVTFEAQTPGTYSAEADSATNFLRHKTPFDIVVPDGCAAA
jgi:hypothetical protein